MPDFEAKMRKKDASRGPKPGITSYLDEETQAAKVDGRFIHLPATHFYPDPNQPRKTFDQSAIDDLCDSIERGGQLQPILVALADADGRHKIIAGERRWRAISQSQKVTEVDAVIRRIDASPQDTELLTLLLQRSENLDRENMLAIEEAEAVSRVLQLCDQLGKDRDAACEMLRMNSGQITKYLALLSAPEDVAGLSRHGETQDVEVLYNLSRIAESRPEAVSGLIDKWRSGDLAGNLRQASKDVLSEVKQKKSGAKKVKENSMILKDANLEVDGDDFCMTLSAKGGKKFTFKLSAELVLKLKRQTNVNER